MVKRYQAKITTKIKVSSKVYRIGFTLVQPDRVEFTAGQFLNLLVDNRTRRSYSIASDPTSTNYLETFVDITPGGPGSHYFLQAQVGQAATLLAPLGNFIFNGPNDLTPNDTPKATEAPAVFLSTGTGITPFFSIIGDELVSKRNARPMRLYQGFRYVEDLFELEKLTSWQQQYSNFQANICLSRPSELWQGREGYVTDNLLADWGTIPQIDVADFYLCGTGDMVEQARQLLLTKGISPWQIFFEKYN